MELEREAIKNVLAEIFPDKVFDLDDGDSFMVKLGMDSITFVSYVIGIEGKFNIDIPEEYSLPSKLDTMKKTLDLIQKERRL